MKLIPTPAQRKTLIETLERANAACNYAANIAWQTKTFRQFSLHGLVYREIRERFLLAAQMAIRVEAKVADAYKLDKKTQRTFRPHGAIAYDSRILKWHVAQQIVSLWTLEGRQTIPFQAGAQQLALLQYQDGESDLILIRGEFYLLATCTIQEPSTKEVEGYLGVDLGVVSLAVTSEGQTFTGEQVERCRKRHAKARQQFQRRTTRGARRRLKKLSGRQRRFQSWTNHNISKTLVASAKALDVGLALEDLTYIRTRIETTARRRQRGRLSNWAFAQLRGFVEYKARLAGVPVCFVDPRNSSRECSQCGYTDKANRKTQADFRCGQCDYTGNADFNAARVLATRVTVNSLE